MSSDNKLYRRQFILGDHPILDFPDWKSILFASHYLSVHPDLDITYAKGFNGEFLMLGFALNHRRPLASNPELIQEMAETCNSIDEMLDYCRDLCGRYVIVYNSNEKIGLLYDLIGSRSVYYCIHQEAIWCASQPNMLATLLGIGEDQSPEVMEYVEKDMFASGEGCWIGDGTKFIGIKHLLPNHYLDLRAKKSVRYWPTCPVGNLDLESASRKSAEILENTLQSATNRFEMCMAVTSGWDSRCMLAATRKISSKVYYYIQKYGEMTDNHPDVRIPRKLANKLGFPFHTIECTDYQDNAFDAILERNVFLVHNLEKKVLYRNFFQSFQGKVNASGNISDLCRTNYGIAPVKELSDLLKHVNLFDSKYALNSLEDWFNETKQLCDTFNYNLRDLFFWEQVLGNWGSMFAAELDIAIDEFYPFGTRRLVDTILAVDERLRPCSNSKVHRRIIKLLWPELLSEPINPTSWQKSLVRFLINQGIRTLKWLGLTSPIKIINSKLRDLL